MRVKDLGFRVFGRGFRVEGSGFSLPQQHRVEVHRRGVEHETLVLRRLGVLGVVQPADSQVMRPSQVVSLIAHLLIRAPEPSVERAGAGNEFFIDNLLLRIHYHRDDWMEIKSLKRQSRSYRSYTAGIKVYRVEVFSYNRNAF